MRNLRNGLNLKFMKTVYFKLINILLAKLTFKTKWCVTAIDTYKCHSIKNTRITRSDGEHELLNVLLSVRYTYICLIHKITD